MPDIEMISSVMPLQPQLPLLFSQDFSHNFGGFLPQLHCHFDSSPARLRPPDRHHCDYLATYYRPRPSTSIGAAVVTSNDGICLLGFTVTAAFRALFYLRMRRPPIHLPPSTSEILRSTPTIAVAAIAASNLAIPGGIFPSSWPDSVSPHHHHHHLDLLCRSEPAPKTSRHRWPFPAMGMLEACCVRLLAPMSTCCSCLFVSTLPVLASTSLDPSSYPSHPVSLPNSLTQTNSPS